jgi:16S rRNA G1207 methylase RsmC
MTIELNDGRVEDLGQGSGFLLMQEDEMGVHHSVHISDDDLTALWAARAQATQGA